MQDLQWYHILQLAFIIPLGWVMRAVWVNTRDIKDTYTKDETDKMIELNLKPTTVLLADLKSDIQYIRRHLERGNDK